MWSWASRAWVPQGNGCKFTVPKQPGRLQKDSSSFDECVEYENGRLQGEFDRYHVFGNDWHLNSIAGGEPEAWLYATDFNSEIWYSVKTLNSWVRRRRWVRELEANEVEQVRHRVDSDGNKIYRY